MSNLGHKIMMWLLRSGTIPLKVSGQARKELVSKTSQFKIKSSQLCGYRPLSD